MKRVNTGKKLSKVSYAHYVVESFGSRNQLDNSVRFMGHQGALPCPEQAATGPNAKCDESSSDPYNLFHKYRFYYYLSVYA